MSNQVELVSVPPIWRTPSGDSFEQAKARFLSHEHEGTFDLKDEKEESDDSPF
ncbi:hypothetical protein PVE_R2G0222 [Pseudomonas veronii 1YdBTEX2]|uniref:Uncharacterized protein n=1 Tax=Pseudomonas veronii 1YdBTEX2 TaxID=1295141 RepID=A0A1D3K7S0_PSEVE|nr:hypothetical protein PVE_R2G0222 [Pseudomonas veronii 1YdBTEX2]